MKFKNIKKQRGFTMIELVIVIAILGILAAFALPRFTNFKNQAATASYESIIGTFNAAKGIVKAKYIANGSTGTTVDMDGNATTTDDIITVTTTGELNFAAITSQATCANLMNALLSNKGDMNAYYLPTGMCQLDNKTFTITFYSGGTMVYLK